jgi:hypothetical protein
LIKIVIPRDKFEDLLTPECVDWLRSRPEGVPQAGIDGAQLWLEFSEPATAAQFEQLWLGKQRASGSVDSEHDPATGKAA